MKLFGTIIVGLLITGCGQQKASQFANRLEEQIEAEAEIIDLVDLTDFDWELMYIIAPYTRKPTLDRILGFSWDGFRRSNIEMRDNITLLLFTKKDKVVFSVDFYRSKCDFSNMTDDRGYTPDEATIIIDYMDEGAIARAG